MPNVYVEECGVSWLWFIRPVLLELLPSVFGETVNKSTKQVRPAAKAEVCPPRYHRTPTKVQRKWNEREEDADICSGVAKVCHFTVRQ
jgi:hypothetical protein